MGNWLSTHRHWLHNANVKSVNLRLGNDSKTVSSFEFMINGDSCSDFVGYYFYNAVLNECIRIVNFLLNN